MKCRTFRNFPVRKFSVRSSESTCVEYQPETDCRYFWPLLLTNLLEPPISLPRFVRSFSNLPTFHSTFFEMRARLSTKVVLLTFRLQFDLPPLTCFLDG